MSRKNEIKKDIWKILREVYGIGEGREITDKQNEFLDKVILYLDDNVSLRRKTDKQKLEQEIDDAPLERPMPAVVVQPVVVTPQKKQKKIIVMPKTDKPKADKPKTEAPPLKINIDALPEHLRKYVK